MGRPPELLDQSPYHTAARQSPRGSDHWPNFGALLDAQKNSAHLRNPHPAVARIIVPEGSVTAFGSGTLVDVREEFGLVITNWHVVRDASGPIEVVFPGGFRSQARALKVDPDWDLAALVIWQPPIEPVTLADVPPKPGDRLTIHGHGKGKYRVATGRCTQFYAPRPNFPQEMVELNVEARQGDSGGPIFNDQGELTGVLFGAGQGTTVGSFGRRVESFLASLAPDIGHPGSQNESGSLLALAPKTQASAPNIQESLQESARQDYWTNRGSGPTNQNFNHFANHSCPPRCSNGCYCPPISPTRGPSQSFSRKPSPDTDRIAARAEASPWQTAAVENSPAAEAATISANSTPAYSLSANNADAIRSDVAPPQATGMADRAKSFLAIVGLLTVCVQIVRVVT